MSQSQSEFFTLRDSPGGITGGHIAELRLTLPAAHARSDTLVLLLPFMGGSARTYDHVVNSLSKKHPDAAYLAISYSGTASTPRPTPPNDQPEMFSVIPRAEQILHILRSPRVAELWTGSRKLVIVAQSMSAKVSYVLLDLLAKERNEAGIISDIYVSGLVLLGPAPVGPLHFPPEMREQQLHAYDSIDTARWTVENILSHRKMSAELVNALAKDCVATCDGAKAGWMNYGMVFDCSDYVTRLSVNWPAIQVRVRVGEYDKVEAVDNVRKQTTQVLRDLGLMVRDTTIQDAGHLLPVEAVEDVVFEVSSLIRRD